MDKPHLRSFGSGTGSVVGAGSDDRGVYSQIGGSDSDDSRSSTSHSEDNEGLPCIIYTSDDSADVGQSDSVCVDSEGIGYIACNVNQLHDDKGSRRLLLDSECPSPQPSTQLEAIYSNTHPLAITFITGSNSDIGQGDDLGLQELSEHPDFASDTHLRVLDGVCNYERSTSMSSSSSSSSPEAQQPLLTEYHLPEFVDFTGVEYEPLQEDSIPIKKMHDPLDMFVDVAEIPTKIQPLLGRCMIGSDVHIDAKYKDAFYVNWNWSRIRHTCVLLNVSTLVSLLCVGTGLLIQMPRGLECNPARTWWQGTVFYEIFVPSFKDSDADGIGDLPGLISKLDYIESLGVKGIRLNSILHAVDYLEDFTSVTNYTSVDPLLGSPTDVELLTRLLHEKELYLLMDIPLTALHNTNSVSSRFVNINHTTNSEDVGLAKIKTVLRYWLTLGVDGFFFPDITEYANDPALVEAMHKWRNLLDQFSHGTEHRIMMVPLELLNTLQSAGFPHLDHVLELIDLIDAPINLTGSAKVIPEVLSSVTTWDNHASLPWINWNMGGVGKGRIADLTHGHPLGRALFLLFLPGTVTLYYGDELALTQSPEKPGWSSVMAWTREEHAGFSSVTPLLWLGDGWEQKNVEAQKESIASLATMIAARQEKVPLYVNGIFGYEGDYHPTKSSNYRIRHADEDLVIIDRFYPRRNQFAIVANFGSDIISQDLSHVYFGGSVLASSNGQTGYVQFRSISLQPGEALACILDL